MKSLYMHTINGAPGTYDGYQVCFAGVAKLEKDLRTIRRQQRASERNREADGMSADDFRLDYVRVLLPQVQPEDE